MKINFRFDKSRYDSAKKQNIQECMEYILEHKYGESIMNNDLAKILGYNIDDEEEKRKYKSIMGRIKNFLIDYGYVLKSINSVGYYILKPQHITSHCFRTYTRRSQRMLDKSLYVLNHIDNTKLEGDRIEEYNKFKELNENLIDEAEKLINSSPYYNRMEYYNNLKD